MRCTSSSNRPISFMRPVRSNSLSASTNPDPQIPSGCHVADHAESEDCHRRQSPLLRSPRPEPACRTRSLRPRKPAPPGQDAARMPMLVADDQLGVGPDVHDRDQPLLMRQIDRQHRGGSVRSHVAADDRRAVHARLGMNRQQAAQSRLHRGSWSRACPRPFQFP